MGIFLVKFFHPLRHGIGISVGVGVHTDAVDTNGLYPPDTVLDEIAHQVRVMLVEVGHGRYKPAFCRLFQVYLGGVGVFDRCQLITGLQILALLFVLEPFRRVQPVFRRHVLRPRMLEA